MTPSGESARLPATSSGDDPLLSLATVRNRMDLLRRFLSDSVNRNAPLGRDQMDLVSSEIASAIHQIIVNGAALLATTAQQQQQTPDPPPPTEASPRQPPGSIRPDPPAEAGRNEWVDGGGDDVVEIDAVELLAEHVHRCEICGKGFKRDANLRMHMRAHGNQFKTPEALAKPQPQIGGGGGGGGGGGEVPGASSSSSSRFSCPFQGCNRNRMHRKFRPLKSVICVRNHFKRSHCPKMYACNRCNKKHFSVLADLKSHLRHCGDSKWKCSCGTSFSRKDKLFGHMALFEGHMPAVAVADDKSTATASAEEVEGDGDRIAGSAVAEANSSNSSDNGFFEGLLEEFGGVDGYCLQDIMLESPSTTGFSVAAGIGNNNNANSVDDFLNF